MSSDVPERTTTMSYFVDLAKAYGLAGAMLVLILVAIGTGAWRASEWIGVNMLQPIVAEQIDLIKTLKASSIRQTENQIQQTMVLTEIKNTLVLAQEVNRKNNELFQGLGIENNGMLKKILSKIESEEGEIKKIPPAPSGDSNNGN